jgi:hypothetical protein
MCGACAGDRFLNQAAFQFPMLRTRSLRRLQSITEGGGWAELPDELLARVLEMLHAAGMGFSPASAAVRLVCAGWKAVHDALVTRLVLRWKTTDEAVGMLARRFPAVVLLEFKGGDGVNVLTDKGLRAVSNLHALTSLDLTYCYKVTDEGLWAVSNLPALTELNLTHCYNVTDEALQAVSSLHALTSLNLRHCRKVTDVGVQAVSNLPHLTCLNLSETDVTYQALRAVSSLPVLTSLNLSQCYNMTDAALRAVRNLPELTSLNLRHCRKVSIVARTEDYAYDASVCDLSIVQVPFSVAPCQTLTLRFATFQGDGREHTSREQPACAHVARPRLLLQGDGRGHARGEQPPDAHLPQPHRLRGDGRRRAGREPPPRAHVAQPQPLHQGDRRGAARGERPHGAHVAQPARLHQGDGGWRAGAPQHTRLAPAASPLQIAPRSAVGSTLKRQLEPVGPSQSSVDKVDTATAAGHHHL